jgi:hypothetical protein
MPATDKPDRAWIANLFCASCHRSGTTMRDDREGVIGALRHETDPTRILFKIGRADSGQSAGPGVRVVGRMAQIEIADD